MTIQSMAFYAYTAGFLARSSIQVLSYFVKTIMQKERTERHATGFMLSLQSLSVHALAATMLALGCCAQQSMYPLS